MAAVPGGEAGSEGPRAGHSAGKRRVVWGGRGAAGWPCWGVCTGPGPAAGAPPVGHLQNSSPASRASASSSCSETRS